MMQRFFPYVIYLIGALLISGCGGAVSQAGRGYVLGDTLAIIDFDAAFEWEAYAHPDLKVDFRVEDRSYRAEAWDGGFMWTINAQTHTDVAIQVDTQQLSTYRDNAYGLMCRAEPSNNGDGYYFLISGDGHYTIRRRARGAIEALIPWTASRHIQQDRAINRMRVVCVGDYLALHVNGNFVDSTTDDRYHSGFAGIAAGVPAGGTVDVLFDRVIIWEAALSQAGPR
ncbi:MAG: hypothetical protein GYB67_10940 [Chloroflexi bacterium]|nr:hypothetical protein [Chloroflexota bacterium]